MQKQLIGGSHVLCTYVYNYKLSHDLCYPNDSFKTAIIASDMYYRHDCQQTPLKLLNISDYQTCFQLLTTMSNFNHHIEIPQTLQAFCLKGTDEFLSFIKKTSALYDIAINHLECTPETQVQLKTKIRDYNLKQMTIFYLSYNKFPPLK